MTDRYIEDLLIVSDADGAGSTVSFTTNPMVLLGLAANRVVYSLSRRFRKFGVGVLHWRLMVTLRREPDIAVTRASEVMGVDKAAVSRTMAGLEKQGLAVGRAPPGDARRRLWRLTERGSALHAELLATTLESQRRQLESFTREDVLLFATYLRNLIANIEAEEDSGGAGSDNQRIVGPPFPP